MKRSIRKVDSSTKTRWWVRPETLFFFGAVTVVFSYIALFVEWHLAQGRANGSATCPGSSVPAGADEMQAASVEAQYMPPAVVCSQAEALPVTYWASVSTFTFLVGTFLLLVALVLFGVRMYRFFR